MIHMIKQPPPKIIFFISWPLKKIFNGLQPYTKTKLRSKGESILLDI